MLKAICPNPAVRAPLCSQAMLAAVKSLDTWAGPIKSAAAAAAEDGAEMEVSLAAVEGGNGGDSRPSSPQRQVRHAKDCCWAGLGLCACSCEWRCPASCRARVVGGGGCSPAGDRNFDAVHAACAVRAVV